MFGEHFIYQEKYIKALNERQKSNPCAAIEGKEECIKCATCCWFRSCCFDKNDVIKIAEFLKTTPQELFNTKLCVDKFKEGYVVLAIRHEQKDCAGSFIDWRRTYDHKTPCIFNDQQTNLCTIHDVKPIGGRDVDCWEHNKPIFIPWKKDDLIELGWDGYDGGDDEY